MCSDELVLTLLEMVRLAKMKALVLLGALLISMAPAEAQSNEAKFYYWNGVAYTAGNLLCGLTKAGKIDKGYARDLLSEIIRSYSEDPSLAPYMSAINQGSKSAKDECPEVY